MSHVNNSSYKSQLSKNHLIEVNNDKFKAFGKFLASSLIELKEVQALSLVEKFTTELVNYLKTEERKKNLSNTLTTAVDEENRLSAVFQN